MSIEKSVFKSEIGPLEVILQDLVGKTVKQIYMSSDECGIQFSTEDGLLEYQTEADCCSETWFADVVGVSELLDEVVTVVEELDIPDAYYVDEDERTRQISDKAYGFRLKTQLGGCDFIFRNSSNGYYTGWIDKVTVSAPYKNQITDDWSA